MNEATPGSRMMQQMMSGAANQKSMNTYRFDDLAELFVDKDNQGCEFDDDLESQSNSDGDYSDEDQESTG